MPDSIGVELSDIDAVREEARRRAFLLLTAGYEQGEDRRNWPIAVRDEHGRVVLSLTLGEAMVWDPVDSSASN
jgi:hypothetical protein